MIVGRRVSSALVLVSVLAAVMLVGGCWTLSGFSGDDSNTHLAGDGGGSTTDATTDKQDGASPIDGGADANTNEGGSTFCDQQPIGLALCADFDQGTVTDVFQFIRVADGGTLDTDPTASTSPGRSMIVRAPAIATTTDSAIVSVDRLFTDATHATFAFDVRFDSLSANGQAVELAAIVFRITADGSAYNGYNLNATSSEMLLGEEQHYADGGGVFGSYPLLLAHPPDASSFVHMVMDIDLLASPRTVTVTVDGATAIDHHPIPAAMTTGPVRAYIGDVFMHGPSDPIEMHFDNVTLRLTDGGT